MITKKDKRTRNWTFILYPESMPDDYLDILNAEHTPVILSPLHNMDINPDGELKKAHIHVLICYESVKSYTQVCELTDKLNASFPQVCNNTKGMVRYFIHMDNPEKYQYKKSNIRTLGYVDLEEYFSISFTEKNLLIADMIKAIRDNGFTEFCDFIDYCIEFRSSDFLPLLSTGGASYFIKAYIQSYGFKHKGIK